MVKNRYKIWCTFVSASPKIYDYDYYKLEMMRYPDGSFRKKNRKLIIGKYDSV